MGDENHLPRGSKLDVSAEAVLNPDIDQLGRIQLVVLGDVAATKAARGQDRVQMKTTVTADHSMWIAVRAYGAKNDPRNTTVAHSAPIYVVVEDKPFWKLSAVPELIHHQRESLNDVLNGPLLPDEDLEEFQTHDLLLDEWAKQHEMLGDRVAEVMPCIKSCLSAPRMKHSS